MLFMNGICMKDITEEVLKMAQIDLVCSDSTWFQVT